MLKVTADHHHEQTFKKCGARLYTHIHKHNLCQPNNCTGVTRELSSIIEINSNKWSSEQGELERAVRWYLLLNSNYYKSNKRTLFNCGQSQ